MERYHEYKDSGEKWLGEIPSHWEVKRIKYIFREVDKRNTQLKYRLLSFSKNKGIVPFSSLKDKRQSSEGLEDYKVIHKGQLLENRMQAWHGMFAKSAIDGCVSPDYSVFQKINPLDDVEYFAKLFRDPLMIQQFAIASKGMGDGFNRLYTPQFGSIYTIYPPFQEQTAMVAYLDRVTAQIDKAIAQQQRMIDLLNERKQIIIQHAVTKGLDPNAEMVDSGVEWIGEMPKGWSVYKLKHICNAFGRIGFRGYSTSDLVEENEGAITLSPSNMKDGGMTYEKCTYLSWKKYEESSEIKIHDGDIIFVKTGSSYGKSSIVYGLPKEATINPQLLVFKDIRCSREFLSYVLMTNSIRNQIETSVIGGTIPTISQNKILNFSFTCPSKREQENIVCKLGELINPIKSSIKKIEKRISFLRERKQIIINEVVTGKVKVS